MKSLAEFFQDDSGGLSMTRLMVFFVIVVPFLAWVGVCIYHWALVDMPTGVLTLQGGAFTAKLLQKQQEAKSTVTP